MLDVRNLRYFIAVAAEGSISRAAETLHIAQPALSVQIKQLEEELGSVLFDRTPKGVVLTAAGRMLRERAVGILEGMERLYTDIREAGAQPHGRVAIGLPQSMARLLTLPLAQAAVARFPGVRLQFIELSTGFVPHYLLKGDIDFGLTFLRPGIPSLSCEKIVDEELVIVGPPGKYLTLSQLQAKRSKAIRAADLQGQAMVLPEKTHSLRVLLGQLERQQELALKVTVEVNSIPQLLELTAAGLGSTILSYAAAKDHLQARLVSVARVAPRLRRSVFCAVWRPRDPPWRCWRSFIFCMNWQPK